MIDWVRENEADAPIATKHVKRALEGLQNIEANPELFEIRTTGPLEREMKEINKRFENGGGWTQEGAESLLWHLQLWLHEPEKWLNNLITDDESVMFDFLQNSLI